MRTRIILADDHPVFCDGFVHMAQAMRPDWSVLAVGSSAARAVGVPVILKPLRPDRLRALPGLDAAR